MSCPHPAVQHAGRRRVCSSETGMTCYCGPFRLLHVQGQPDSRNYNRMTPILDGSSRLYRGRSQRPKAHHSSRTPIEKEYYHLRPVREPTIRSRSEMCRRRYSQTTTCWKEFAEISSTPPNAEKSEQSLRAEIGNICLNLDLQHVLKPGAGSRPQAHLPSA